MTNSTPTPTTDGAGDWTASRAQVDARQALRAILTLAGGEARRGQLGAQVILGFTAKSDWEAVGPALSYLIGVAKDGPKPGSDMDSFLAYPGDFVRAFRETCETLAAASPEAATAVLVLGADPEAELEWQRAVALYESSVLRPAASRYSERASVLPASTSASEPGPGVRLVVYQYCVSLVLVSLKRTSPVKVIADGGSRVLAGLPYSLVSLVFGWWGVPWGPFWTIQTTWRNFHGGIDVTDAALGRGGLPPELGGPEEPGPLLRGSPDGWRR